ncbi:AH receptor-interacting protein-like [Octopus vulgaris]|uniref:AH receptor-interacting protein-like n=1 Tax=Octopus vulgaris TaxID=6645 RepID=A0AA36BIL2_OCTVU|nr:AH receptor-interacting protein-like [Octopus vulgaris]
MKRELSPLVVSTMADIFRTLAEEGIQKRILFAGQGEIPDYADGKGWKLTFHYVTKMCDEDSTILDDSRKMGKPMELLLGKKFKFDVWEKCIRSMKINEVAEFLVNTDKADTYPLVAKSLRDIAKPEKKEHGHTKKDAKGHCCGMMSMTKQSLGYPDLDKLMAKPEPLLFTLELTKIEAPGGYKQESWELNESEKLAAVPKLREEGNELYRDKKFKEANEKYAEALGMLEELMLSEKPGDEAWQKLNTMQIPLLLNFCQCKLMSEDYYTVITHCNTVLKYDPDNVKALFRRGKAHIGSWNPEAAKRDLERVIELDSSLTKGVRKELKHLEQLQRAKDNEDREKLRGKIF